MSGIEIMQLIVDHFKHIKELNDSTKNILKNGTIEQKVDLLVSDYMQRMEYDENQKMAELQKVILEFKMMSINH